MCRERKPNEGDLTDDLVGILASYFPCCYDKIPAIDLKGLGFNLAQGLRE